MFAGINTAIKSLHSIHSDAAGNITIKHAARNTTSTSGTLTVVAGLPGQNGDNAIDVRSNSTKWTSIQLENNNSPTVNTGSISMAGTAWGNYRGIASNALFLYTQSTAGIVLCDDIASGFVRFSTAGGVQVNVSDTGSSGSAVNWVDLTGATSTNGPIIAAKGTDSNIALVLRQKGTNGIQLQNDSGANLLVVAPAAGTQVNYIQINSNVTTSSPTISAQGSDSNVGFLFQSKGTGAVTYQSAGGSNTQFQILGTTASTNYLTVSGTTTTGKGGTISANSTGTIDFAQQVNYTVGASLTAAGSSSQANALGLTADINHVSTAAANTGVRLPTAVVGMVVRIINRGASTMNVYPATGGAIDALGANAASTMATNTTKTFVATTTTQWWSM